MMSLKAHVIHPVPEETARVTRAAFPHGSPSLTFREALGTIFQDGDFTALFPACGQPGLPPWRPALVTVMQFRENLADRQAAEAVRARIDWKYLLGLELTDPGFDFSVLSEFRDRLLTGSTEALLLDQLLVRCRALGLLKARGQQRLPGAAGQKVRSRVQFSGHFNRKQVSSAHGTRGERRQGFQREQQTKKRLRLATTRLYEAEQERIWATVAAYDAGLSIRQIATAMGLSRSRIHQRLQEPEAREIPTWLTHLRAGNDPASGEVTTTCPAPLAAMQALVAEEVEVLRWCIDWPAQLERGETVVVNLRPDTEDATEFVRFDQARVRRVLARIAAALDTLARHGPATDTERPEEPTDPRTRHRRRLAESEEKSRGRTAKEQRDVLRHACGLPPYSGDYADCCRHTRGTNW